MNSASSKPIADLSLDLDNQWSYMKTSGVAGWDSYPSYLSLVTPHILESLNNFDLRITFMVVGLDATIEENLPPLKEIASTGHEIGNHSFKHEPWLQRYCWGDVVDELRAAEDALHRFCDRDIVGFRGPGYSLSSDVLDWLSQQNYIYDASTFPTFLGPISRLYYFFRSGLTTEEKLVRSSLFGSFADGFRRLRPYKWVTNYGEILEIPVSTMPISRMPFHFTYLHFLGQFSPLLARTYFKMCLFLCKVTKYSPSLLMHPLDFLGGDEIHPLRFFPGMKSKGVDKRKLMKDLLQILTRSFDVRCMREKADLILTSMDQPLPAKRAQLIAS